MFLFFAETIITQTTVDNDELMKCMKKLKT